MCTTQEWVKNVKSAQKYIQSTPATVPNSLQDHFFLYTLIDTVAGAGCTHAFTVKLATCNRPKWLLSLC